MRLTGLEVRTLPWSLNPQQRWFWMLGVRLAVLLGVLAMISAFRPDRVRAPRVLARGGGGQQLRMVVY